MLGRATSFLAPFLVATVTAAAASPRAGMAVITVFFIIGFIILYGAPKPSENRIAATA